MSTEEVIEAHEEFATDNLSLAAYLRMRGYCHDRIEVDRRGSASWVYLDSDSLQDEISGFYEGSAQVEPSKFTQILGGTRRELYDFLKERDMMPQRNAR